MFILVGCSARVNLPSGLSGFRVVEGERKHAVVEVNNQLTRENLLNWNVREVLEDNEILYILAIIDEEYVIQFVRAGLQFGRLSETGENLSERAFYCYLNYEEQVLECNDFYLIARANFEEMILTSIDEEEITFEEYFERLYFWNETSERFFNSLIE